MDFQTVREINHFSHSMLLDYEIRKLYDSMAYFLTRCFMYMCVIVRNIVTINVTLPGIAVNGIKKLIMDTMTMAKHGR